MLQGVHAARHQIKKTAEPCEAAHFGFADTVLAVKQFALKSFTFKSTDVRDQARELHACLEMMLMGLQPFEIVENRMICIHVKVDRLGVETL